MHIIPNDAPSGDAPAAPARFTFLFILFTIFLSAMGMTIVIPVLPFIIQRSIGDSSNLATAVGWLTATYAICQFIAAPALGVLSDRFGRRPLLLLCLLGSTFGYLIFGIGGALWVLFAGRIIDGLTGGDMSILAAYIGDISAPAERSKRFGQIGGVAGVGLILGPVIGGLLARVSYAAPFYLSAGILFATTIWGFFALPESLRPQDRIARVGLADLNPLKQIGDILAMDRLRWLLMTSVIYAFPFAMFTTELAVLAMDALQWTPAAIGFLLLVIGIIDILMQTFLAGWLIRRVGETRLIVAGLLCEAASYALIGAVAIVPNPAFMVAGIIVFAVGSGLLEPPLNGLISAAAGPSEQGVVQGGQQALRALAEIFGPLLGGVLYAQVGGEAPYWLGALLLLLGVVTIRRAMPHLAPGRAAAELNPANG